MNRWLWLLVSLEFTAALGNQLLSLAVYSILILGLERSAQNLLMLFVGAQVTALLLVPTAGPLLERLGPGKVLLFSGLCKAVLLSIMTVTSHIAAPVFLQYALIMGLDIFQISGRSAALPLLVRREDLIKGNAIRQKTSVCANVLGPAAMGLLVAELGARSGMAAGAVLFGLAGLGGALLPLKGSIPPERPRREEETRFKFGEFFRYSPGLREILWITLFWMAAGGLFQYGFPLWFSEKPAASAFGMGIAFSLFNLGALGGALVVFKLRSDQMRKVLRKSLFVEALCILGLALTANGVALEGGLLLLIGAASAVQQVMLESSLQAGCPPSLLPRIMPLGAGLRTFGSLAGTVLGALAVHQFGMISSLVLAGIGFALISMGIGRREYT